MPTCRSGRRYFIVGLIVQVTTYGCLTLQADTGSSEQVVQRNRSLLPKGWQNQQQQEEEESEVRHRFLPSKKNNIVEKRNEFLDAIEHQIMEHEISTKSYYQSYGQQQLLEEEDYDRANIFNRGNGVYYDPKTGTFIDPKLIIPIDNDNDGLYYDPVSGSILSNTNGALVPDTYYYYARKGNGDSKSHKNKKNKCHKKNHRSSKKGGKSGKGKSGKGKKKSKWYDECAYQTPNIHPDKDYPKRCIYDYANYIRYCKRKSLHFIFCSAQTCFFNIPNSIVSLYVFLNFVDLLGYEHRHQHVLYQHQNQ
jgi:hypothetical protein